MPSLDRLSGLTTDGRLVAYSSGGDGPDGVLVYDLDRGTSTAALPVAGYGRVVVRPDDTVLVEGTLYALPQILSLDPLVWHATLCLPGRGARAVPCPADDQPGRRRRQALFLTVPVRLLVLLSRTEAGASLAGGARGGPITTSCIAAETPSTGDAPIAIGWGVVVGR